MIKEIIEMLRNLDEGTAAVLSVVLVMFLAALLMTVIKKTRTDTNGKNIEEYTETAEERSHAEESVHISAASTGNRSNAQSEHDYHEAMTVKRTSNFVWHITAYDEGKHLLGEYNFLAGDIPIAIGRSQNCDICIDDSSCTMGRYHCSIISESGSLYLISCGTNHEMRSAGKRLRKVRLENGLSVSMGEVELVFELVMSF